MATAETVDLGPLHEPKEASITAFEDILVDIKRSLQHLRHDHDKHEPEYFAAVKDLSNEQLTNFDAKDLVLVRIATTAYGLHLFGKVSLPESDGGYIHFRAFIGGEKTKEGEQRKVELHSIHTEETEAEDGSKSFRAIFRKDDPLEWFET